jgi:hypothetical protein
MQPPARDQYGLNAPNTPSPPLPHRPRRVLVRPRIHQRPHHLEMAVLRGDVERRGTILRQARPHQQPAPAPHPGPAHLHPFVFKPSWSRNLAAPGPAGLFSFRGRGGSSRFIFDPCAHPSQTRRGAFLLQEMANGRTGTPLCSPFWCVSEQKGELLRSCRPKKRAEKNTNAQGRN